MYSKLRVLTRISDPNAITEALINAHLNLQLDWYCTFVDPLTGSTAVKVPKKNVVSLKVLKITALKDAITRYELLSPEIREDVEARVGGLETDNDVVGKAAGEESDDDV